MPATAWTPETIAEPLRTAFEAADLEAIGALLSPDVRWGPPGSKNPPCKNREQVLKWYRNGPAWGARARVIELTAAGDQLLVGLALTSNPEAELAAERWQVLTIHPQGVCDIRGYEDRHSAEADLAHAP